MKTLEMLKVAEIKRRTRARIVREYLATHN